MSILVVNVILLVIAFVLILAERFLVNYGECAVIVNEEKTLDAAGGENLLSALTRHRIFIPSACGGKATCGFCKVTVTGGAGEALSTELGFLTREERQEGVRLSCQVKIKGKVDIAIPEYMLGAKEFTAEVLLNEKVTYDMRWLRLKLIEPKTIHFKPGQYVQLLVPGTDEFRAYSVASTPDAEDIIDFTIRLVPGGLCSTFVHRALEKGDRMTFTGPFGDFYLNEESDKEIVGIAGGAGMAPIRSIAHYLANRGMKRKFSFFFGARSTKDLFFTEELRELEEKYPNFKYYPALSEPTPEDRWEGETGFITQTAEKYLDSTTPKEAYLCGPPPMIDAAFIVLQRKGIKAEDIQLDKF